MHSVELDEIYQELDTSPEGLTSREAEKRLEQYGRNELEREGGVNPLEIFVEQFRDFLVITLLVAALISAGIGEVIDAAVITVILIVNAVFGFVQDYRAEKALEALKEMTHSTCTVLRGGEEIEMDVEDLVPGDIVLLRPGDKVPADARLIKENNLRTQEAALTGESSPVSKDLGVLDEDTTVVERTNMVFMGTSVVHGVGKAVITSTGMDTELGRIASMVQEEKGELPLERRMKELSRKLGIGSLIVVAVVFLAGVLKNLPLTFELVREMFILSVALAVAAIPEGLPAVVTISLALGVRRMVERNSIIRRLPSVETLGSVSVICTDKTGTLTQNRMTATRLYCDGETYEVTGKGYEPEGEILLDGEKTGLDSEALRLMLRAGVLCNDADLVKEERWEIRGDPTEGCLLPLAEKAGISREEVRTDWKRLSELPFDSDRKMMTTIDKDRTVIAHVKGAPEAVLEKCDRIMEDGEVRELTDEDRVEIHKKTADMASDALRLLGFAYKEEQERDNYPLETEDELVFLGIVGMIDPPREGIKKSIAEARDAGIRTIMVTGDNAMTASAIADDIGMESEVVEGKEIDKMDEEEFSETVKKKSVFARVSPEHKVRIVESLKNEQEIVAMTGDGVNDAPALKKSDVGIAMGISGTDVTKEASDMVLTDDNYTSIVAAVEEGRGVFDNIQKFVNYLLSSNAGEVMTLFFGTLLFPHLPLLALQILWVNLVTDGLPAIALGTDPVSPDIMDRPPAPKGKTVLDKDKIMFLLTVGAGLAVGSLFLFWLNLPQGIDYARTVAFTTLVVYQLVNVFICRTNGTIFTRESLTNRNLFGAVFVSLMLQFVVLYVAPIAALFEVVPISAVSWGQVIIVVMGIVAVTEIVKRKPGWRIISEGAAP